MLDCMAVKIEKIITNMFMHVLCEVNISMPLNDMYSTVTPHLFFCIITVTSGIEHVTESLDN